MFQNVSPREAITDRGDISMEQILPNLSFEDVDAEEADTFSAEAAEQVEAAPHQYPNKRHHWITVATYYNLEEALEHITSEEFVHHNDFDLKCGQKFHFRCKRVPADRKPWCNSKYTLFLPSDRPNTYLVLYNNMEHNCKELMNGVKKRLSDEMNDYIFQLFEMGTLANKAVLAHITTEKEKGERFCDEDIPNKRQLEYLLSKYKNNNV